MLRFLHAEWIKVVKNHLLATALVWVYPIGAAAVYGIGILLFGAFVDNPFSPTLWTNDAVQIFGAIIAFPASLFGRLLPLAFMAVVFGGEYQWGTWKNIIPRRSRWSLVIGKMIILIAMVLLSLVLTSAIIVAFQGLGHNLNGLAYNPELTSRTFVSSLLIYLREAGFVAISLSILTSFAAIAAILTQSVLGSLLISFGLSMFETLSGLLLLVIGSFLGIENLVNLYQYTPSYCILNMRSWVVDGILYSGEGFTAEPSLGASRLILAVWVFGLIAISLWLFQKQDITS